MIRIVLWISAGMLFSGCGGYLYTEVHADPAPYDVVYTDTFYMADRVGHIQLSWDISSDLDLELLTPNYHLVFSDGAELDGCSHLGDDFGLHGGGFEEIICFNPPPGGYEVHITNLSDFPMTAHLHTLYEVGHGYSTDIWDESRKVIVSPGDTVYLPVLFE